MRFVELIPTLSVDWVFVGHKLNFGNKEVSYLEHFQNRPLNTVLKTVTPPWQPCIECGFNTVGINRHFTY